MKRHFLSLILLSLTWSGWVGAGEVIPFPGSKKCAAEFKKSGAPKSWGQGKTFYCTTVDGKYEVTVRLQATPEFGVDENGELYLGDMLPLRGNLTVVRLAGRAKILDTEISGSGGTIDGVVFAEANGRETSHIIVEESGSYVRIPRVMEGQLNCHEI